MAKYRKIKMKRRFKLIVIAFTIAKVRCGEPELPLCPTNIQFFPQNLPMHCRMPLGAKVPAVPSLPQGFLQGMPLDKQPVPIPYPGPPGMPVPGPFPMAGPGPFPMPGPGPFPMPGPGPFPMPGPGGPPIPGPGPFPMPGPGTFPMPMSMPAPGPAHKLPVIVMPMYSPDPSFKNHKAPLIRKEKVRVHKRPRDISSDTDTDGSSDTDSSFEDRRWWRGSRGFRKSSGMPRRRHRSRRHRHNRQDLLTPILQYVTKDGYVIFEKKISKGEAKDWLKMKKDDNDGNDPANAIQRNEHVVQRTDFGTPESEFDSEIEIPDEMKDKSKEQVEMQTERTLPRKHFPHKIKPNKNHIKEDEKEDNST